MADDYTPSVDEAREGYCIGAEDADGVPFDEGRARFDRMIAQVRAEAWGQPVSPRVPRGRRIEKYMKEGHR